MLETSNYFLKTHFFIFIVQLQIFLCFYLYYHLHDTIKHDVDNRLLVLNRETKLDTRTMECVQQLCIKDNALPLLNHKPTYHILKKRQSSCGLPGPPGPPGHRGLPGHKGEPGIIGPPGLIGIQGINGPKGTLGPRGIPGFKGDKGDFGIPGPPGISGRRGEPGEKGEKGYAGMPGPPGFPGGRGLIGLKGDSGPEGPIGPIGPKGEFGFQGIPGVPGLRGIIGAKGDKGEMGSIGAPGVIGSIGPPGIRGSQGNEGKQGDKGEAGKIGAQGPPGVSGRPGITGEKGQKGDSGIQGLPGFPGVPGLKGFQGSYGPPGLQGVKGEPGFQGPPGFNGPPGAKGEKGSQGIRGLRGKQGLRGPSWKNENLKISKYGERNYSGLLKRNTSCVLYGPVLSEYKKESDPSHGRWLADPKPKSPEDKQKRWVIDPKNFVLEEYLSEDSILLEEVNKFYDLYLLDSGISFIYEGLLFSIVSPKRPAVIKYFLNNQTNQILNIPELATAKLQNLYKEGLDFIDFSIDDLGAWIIFSVPSSNNTGILKLNTDSLNVEYIWNITLNHNTLNKLFIAHGVLYGVVIENDYIKIPTAIDLLQNQFYDVNIVLSNPTNHITVLNYNYQTYELIVWNEDHRWDIPLQCINTNNMFEDVSVPVE